MWQLAAAAAAVAAAAATTRTESTTQKSSFVGCAVALQSGRNVVAAASHRWSSF
jgi:hypothetical protein